MKIILITFIFLFTVFQSANAGGIPGVFTLNPEIQGKLFVFSMAIPSKFYRTNRTKKPVRIRLANIDAPEKKQAFGCWSANQLKALLAAQPVTVTYTQRDRYGRIIGRVFTTNGTDASRFMVKSGAAWVYERYNADESLPALQREAQEQKRGLWADSNPVPPWEWRHKQN
ncbi:thermonuclease family protein [Escherichia coli]|nr:thermonuclease family protein [Escherichia coli]